MLSQSAACTSEEIELVEIVGFSEEGRVWLAQPWDIVHLSVRSWLHGPACEAWEAEVSGRLDHLADAWHSWPLPSSYNVAIFFGLPFMVLI